MDQYVVERSVQTVWTELEVHFLYTFCEYFWSFSHWPGSKNHWCPVTKVIRNPVVTHQMSLLLLVHQVTLEEFIDGIMRCKGPARAIDQATQVGTEQTSSLKTERKNSEGLEL